MSHSPHHDRIAYGGTLYSTIAAAAKSWAADALPDVSEMVADNDNAWEAACELEAHIHAEAARVGLKSEPNDVDSEVWRGACREALADRIDRRRYGSNGGVST